MSELYKQIDSCDTLLENLEGQLTTYLGDLALINDDMQRLKEQSIVLSQQLHNRQKSLPVAIFQSRFHLDRW